MKTVVLTQENIDSLAESVRDELINAVRLRRLEGIAAWDEEKDRPCGAIFFELRIKGAYVTTIEIFQGYDYSAVIERLIRRAIRVKELQEGYGFYITVSDRDSEKLRQYVEKNGEPDGVRYCYECPVKKLKKLPQVSSKALIPLYSEELDRDAVTRYIAGIPYSRRIELRDAYIFDRGYDKTSLVYMDEGRVEAVCLLLETREGIALQYINGNTAWHMGAILCDCVSRIKDEYGDKALLMFITDTEEGQKLGRFLFGEDSVRSLTLYRI